MTQLADSHEHTEANGRTVNPWWATVAAFCASLVGIGLARFAYTPLLPAIIGAHWFDASMAAYLGASNLAGYLAGALVGQPIAARSTVPVALRTLMILASVSFIACAYPISFSWFFFWRFASGLAGGVLMVLAAPSVLPLLPPLRRGIAGGFIFMGVGVGVAASGTLVPLLLKLGLHETWIGLGVLSLVLTAIAWTGWPTESKVLHKSSHSHAPPKTGALRSLYIEYALNAAGWVPHMIFLVDFVARGLGKGLQVGASYWIVFGIGAMAGPVLAGGLADKIGFGRALRLAFILEIGGILVPALGLGSIYLLLSSVVVGAFVTGTVPLVLGRIHELIPHHPAQQKVAWRTATVAFALFQAVAAYGFSFIFSRSGGDYKVLFVIGAGAMIVALVIDLLAGRANKVST